MIKEIAMEIINLPNGEKLVTDWNLNDVEEVIKRFCGEEFATGVVSVIKDLQGQADYETLKFNSDMEAYEWENEDLRTTLVDIENLIQQYENKLESGQEKFSRQRIFKLFNEIHKEVEKVI